MNKFGVPYKNCNPCAILSGYGGAGTFSDGKLNFIPKLGKSDLTKYMSLSEAEKLIYDTEVIFNKFNMDAEVYPSNIDEAHEIRKKVAIAGAKLLLIKQKHLGSKSKLPNEEPYNLFKLQSIIFLLSSFIHSKYKSINS